jgi:hypothetical protein
MVSREKKIASQQLHHDDPLRFNSQAYLPELNATAFNQPIL